MFFTPNIGIFKSILACMIVNKPHFFNNSDTRPHFRLSGSSRKQIIVAFLTPSIENMKLVSFFVQVILLRAASARLKASGGSTLSVKHNTKSLKNECAEDLQRDLLNFLSMISNENSKIDVIYPHLFLSENNSSLVNRVIDGNSNQFLPFYYDDDHVNRFGSEPIIGKFMELLE